MQVSLHLRPLGLCMKGFEVRGWRESPLRKHLTHVRRVMRKYSAPKLPSLAWMNVSPLARLRLPSFSVPSPLGRMMAS